MASILATSEKPKEAVHFLIIGLEPAARDSVVSAINPDVSKMTELPYNLEKLMEPFDPAPHIILCGPPPQDIQLVEVAQMLRMQYPENPIYFVSFSRTGYDRKIFQKNGFTDAYLLPMDLDFLKQSFSEFIAKFTQGKIKTYRSVKILDIEPGRSLDFDTSIYLPANNKYIRYSAAGEPMDQERVTKLSQHKMSSVYVSTDQMQKFYEYSARRLKDIGSSQAFSATEKKEKLEGAVRDLMHGIFNDTTKESTFEHGQSLVTDCKQIVNNFICESPAGDWYKRLMQTMGEMSSSYCHSGNVSTYAALFSIGLGIGDPAELATAGLLHDIGLADVPPEIVNKPEADRTKEGQATYQKHPEYSVNILKMRKLILSEKIIKAILQHHECFNGQGYPHGYVGSRICKEAQILSLADKFDYLTSAAQGRPLMTPKEAIQYFKKQLTADPANMVFDPDLIKATLKLFPQDS